MTTQENAMVANFTADACLARADELTRLADRSNRYDLILVYDDLAQEWRRLATLIASSQMASHESPGSAGGPGAKPPRPQPFRLG